MSVSHTFTLGWKTSGGASFTRPVTIEDDGELNLDVVVPTGTTNQAASLAIDVSKLSGLVIDCNCNVAIKTNSTSVPDNTFNLLASIPLVWFATCYYANPLTVDTTIVYITNASGQQALVRFRALYES